MPEYRCYHCDEVFADDSAAEAHFGLRCDEPPTCLCGEQGVELERHRLANRRLRTVIDRAQSLVKKVTGIIDKQAGPTLPTTSVRSNWRALRQVLDATTSADSQPVAGDDGD